MDQKNNLKNYAVNVNLTMIRSWVRRDFRVGETVMLACPKCNKSRFSRVKPLEHQHACNIKVVAK